MAGCFFLHAAPARLFLIQMKMQQSLSPDTPHYIDIEAIVAAKLPGRRLPRPLIGYLKRIVHVEELNRGLEQLSGARGLEFVSRLIDYMGISYSVEGRERFPRDGRNYIFACNHPLGGLDGIVLAHIIGQEYGENIRLLVNDILLFVEPMRELFIPVNKLGAQGRNNATRLNDFYHSGMHLVTFPSGKCSRKTKGRIIDPEWKKNFITKAVEYRRDVVPLRFEGRNSAFFYNLANLRTALGIKVNVEMLYLADEFFRQKGAHFKVRVGNPVPWTTFDKSRTPTEWAAWMRDLCYSL